MPSKRGQRTSKPLSFFAAAFAGAVSDREKLCLCRKLIQPRKANLKSSRSETAPTRIRGQRPLLQRFAVGDRSHKVILCRRSNVFFVGAVSDHEKLCFCRKLIQPRKANLKSSRSETAPTKIRGQRPLPQGDFVPKVECFFVGAVSDREKLCFCRKLIQPRKANLKSSRSETAPTKIRGQRPLLQGFVVGDRSHKVILCRRSNVFCRSGLRPRKAVFLQKAYPTAKSEFEIFAVRDRSHKDSRSETAPTNIRGQRPLLQGFVVGDRSHKVILCRRSNVFCRSGLRPRKAVFLQKAYPIAKSEFEIFAVGDRSRKDSRSETAPTGIRGRRPLLQGDFVPKVECFL
jgi:ribosomal protein S17